MIFFTRMAQISTDEHRSWVDRGEFQKTWGVKANLRNDDAAR